MPRFFHGLFTHHLLDALYGKGDADADGQVTAREAKAHLTATEALEVFGTIMGGFFRR